MVCAAKMANAYTQRNSPGQGEKHSREAETDEAVRAASNLLLEACNLGSDLTQICGPISFHLLL
jgi:hypothetical protein